MFSQEVNERTSAVYTATLTDASGAVVPSATLATLVLWLFDRVTSTIINSRGTAGGAGQNVLNTNNVTVDSAGLLTWLVQPADNIIVTSSRRKEDHRAVFKATWGTNPVNGLTHEIEIWVINVGQVT